MSVGDCLVALEPARLAKPVVNPQASIVPVGGVVMSTLPITAGIGLDGNVGLVSSPVTLTETSAASVTDARPSVTILLSLLLLLLLAHLLSLG